ncbi:MAG: hypothetical protein Pars2KO_12970 [Parasphingorhabdus sp.]
MRFNRLGLTTLSSLAFIGTLGSVNLASDCTGQTIVENYTQAYNARDAEQMGRLMDEDIQWLTAKNDKVAVTVQGKSNMITGLADYFKSPMVITSSLDGWGNNGDYVSVVETASWVTKSGDKKSQSSNAVYQIESCLIRRVWYFPEQKVVDVAGS